MNSVKFRQRLKELVKEQKNVKGNYVMSDLSGTYSDAISRFLRGEVEQPTLETAEKWADYFEVNIDFLVGRTDERIRMKGKD